MKDSEIEHNKGPRMSQLKIEDIPEDNFAIQFCDAFTNSSLPKYIFGTNEFADSICQQVEVDGFIDDFSDESSHFGKPIVPIEEVPSDSLVVSAVTIGKPIRAESRLRQFQFRSLDYFAFYKYSKLKLEEIWYWKGFFEDFYSNRNKYEWIYSSLADQVSRNQFYNLLNFRLSYDIGYMRGFLPIEERQYFEPFLNLNKNGRESFADVGAFDGFTSEAFIRVCPDYCKIFLFEPEDGNMQKAKRRLERFGNIVFFQMGLSDSKAELRLNASGSSSRISDKGNLAIHVDRLDDVLHEPVSFIKIDIEGAESSAIAGAKETIWSCHPKIAVAAYHKASDFWQIPEQILSIRNDYSIYLRHYTEGFAETVLYFVPVKL